jgi:hypothetical protein
VSLISIGSFTAVQSMFGISVKGKMRVEITQQKEVLKDQGICLIDGSDEQSHGVPNCQHKLNETLVVIFKQDTVSIKKYPIKR